MRFAPLPDSVPCAGPLKTVKARLSPSASEPDSITGTAVSLSVPMPCAFATGVSLLPAMLTVTEVSVPSALATEKVSVWVVPAANSLWAELAA